MVAHLLAVSGPAETNVPLLVAGVFAVTFLVVCGVAYLLLSRSASRPARREPTPTLTPAPPLTQADTIPRPSEWQVSSVLPAVRERDAAPPLDGGLRDAPGGTPMASVAAPSAPPNAGKSTVVMLYRLLMFATGLAGLLASFLMFSAVTEFSRLVVVATVVLGLSLLALYRGFVPDPELTRRR